jgi:hypothetical protein
MKTQLRHFQPCGAVFAFAAHGSHRSARLAATWVELSQAHWKVQKLEKREIKRNNTLDRRHRRLPQPGNPLKSY